MQGHGNLPGHPVVGSPLSNAEGASLIPVWGVKIPHAVRPKKENLRHLFFDLLKSVSLLRHFPVDLMKVPKKIR